MGAQATQRDGKLNRPAGRLDKILSLVNHRSRQWLEGAMEEASEYREHAAECRAIADTLDGPHREQLLRMAQTWDRLAQEHSAPASQPPLVADPDDAKGG
jgi:hypothetical protein